MRVISERSRKRFRKVNTDSASSRMSSCGHDISQIGDCSETKAQSRTRYAFRKISADFAAAAASSAQTNGSFATPP